MYLQSWCDITCSMTLYRTNWSSLCAIWNVLHRLSSSKSGIIVAISFVTNFFTVDINSQAMTSLFFSLQLSVRQQSFSILASSSAVADTSLDQGCHFLFKPPSHANIEMSLFASVLATLNDGFWRWQFSNLVYNGWYVSMGTLIGRKINEKQQGLDNVLHWSR